MIEMFQQQRHFKDDKIFDPFSNVLLNMMTSSLLQYFQSYIMAAKIASILAMQVLVYS